MQKILAAGTVLLILALGITLWLLGQSRGPALDAAGRVESGASSSTGEAAIPRRRDSAPAPSGAEAATGEDEVAATSTKVPPILTGRVRFLDLKRHEIEPLAATMTLLLLGEDAASIEKRSIAVEGGRFSLPLAKSDLEAVMIESLTLRDDQRSTSLEGKRHFELASLTGSEVELVARLQARVSLRVLDDATGRDLHEVRLKPVPGRGDEEDLITGSSPLLLDLAGDLAFSCSAPDRVPVEVVLDDQSEGERIVVLCRGGGLQIDLESDLDVLPPGRGLEVRLTDLGTGKTRQIFGTRVFPARCDLEALPLERHRLEVLLTRLPSSESLVFARDLTIESGQIARVNVRVKADDLERQGQARLRGSFLLPRAVEGFAYRTGFVEDVWGRRVPSTLGYLEHAAEQALELRFADFDLAPGEYRACLGNESFPFTAAAGETRDLRFELGLPGRLELVIAGMSGSPEDSSVSLSWWSATQSQVPVLPRDDGVFVVEGGPGPIEVEVVGSTVRSRHLLEIPQGTKRVTLDTRPSLLALIRFESRGTVIRDEALLAVEVFADDGRRVSDWGHDGRERSFQLPGAGRYRLHFPRAPAGYLTPDDLLIDLVKPRTELVIELRPRW